MKCGLDFFHALLVLIALLTPGLNSTKLYLGKSFLRHRFWHDLGIDYYRLDVNWLWHLILADIDEVLADAIEKLFGAVVQDEFTELIDNCPDASTSLKVSFICTQ